MQKIALIGGDSRQIHAAATLEKAGLTPFVYGNDGAANAGFTAPYTIKETLEGAKAVILPVPSVKKKGQINAPHSETEIPLPTVWQHLAPSTTVFLYGRENCKPPAQIHALDLAEDENLLEENAAITAEAALALAIESSGRVLRGAQCSVVGYGRIGKALSRLACAWGAKVTVVARQGSNCNLAQKSGFSVRDPQGSALFAGADLIFNTVPAPILTEKSFENTLPTALYLELASQPGGIAPLATIPIQRIHAPGLPGKYCPKSAGIAIGKCVLEHLGVKTW